MTLREIQILHPVTGEVLHTCPGPDPSGRCPMAGPDGVVPCAGLMIAPPRPDPPYWPLRIPPGYRYCDVPWNEKVRACLRKAENCRRRWDAGLRRSNMRVHYLAEHRDPRYRKMSPRDLDVTALWYWRLSGTAQGLRRSEQRAQEQADTYLAAAERRRTAAG
ncbi:hypothetical protein FHR83_008810 [Actinoplanes campanulatus]|uniref:Uncharacterized protein n=1 Tax=Actinoplanes campanulatus TaxID=113559 RepID=A0A7W5FJX9_9ACTN|nr:hypothetical protein [Actinoplanes campanulatus]MBB3101082.1 hypothetical protein [Actinoplanes campanulatus]GGN52004.1 hypothetical protein GCM10010109_92640 [Actinoplanes campanulatus]GID42057.1 hypothetical protein Aca09nite_85630 [Actinoplanes campanulatus]